MMTIMLTVMMAGLGCVLNPDWNLFAPKPVNAFATLPKIGCKSYNAKHKTPGGGGGTDTISVSGRISDDGKKFTTDCDQQSWSITNSNVASGYTGRHVKMQGDFSWNDSQIDVKSLKALDNPVPEGSQSKK